MSDIANSVASETPEAQHAPDEVSLMTQRARQVWDERLGLTVAAARQWRLACFAAIGVAFVAVIGIAYIGSQSSIKPYGLALRGDEVLPMPAMQALPETQLERLYQHNIRDFVESMRTVVSDVEAQKKLVIRGYAHLRPQTPAYTQLTQQFKNLPPFERAKTELVKVQMGSVLPLSAHTYQVDWRETSSDLNGIQRPERRYKATITTEVVEPTTLQAIYANPLGLYITDFNDVEIQ